MTAGYERLLALAERELALVTSGAWDDLAALEGERGAALAALPPVPPQAARPLLERTAGVQQVISAALQAARVETGTELSQLRRGRGAVRGYAAGAGAGAPSLRLDDVA